jgi:hypothetical protein
MLVSLLLIDYGLKPKLNLVRVRNVQQLKTVNMQMASVNLIVKTVKDCGHPAPPLVRKLHRGLGPKLKLNKEKERLVQQPLKTAFQELEHAQHLLILTVKAHGPPALNLANPRLKEVLQ